MKQVHGDRHFDFMPSTFLLPQEYDLFYTAYLRTGGRWIVKPVTTTSTHQKSSYPIDSLAELPTRLKSDDRFLVQKYIDSGLKVNGCRFDVRVYVAVTGFNPLRVFVYKEGVVRYVKEYKNDTTGQKSSLSSLLRHISNQHGSSASALLMAKIKDLIVKTFLSGESVVATAVNMLVPHPGNCFELVGFDLIIDSNLNPWLIGVTTNPSLACETQFDLDIKAVLLADLLTLTGLIPFQKQKRPTGSTNSAPTDPKPCRPPRGETTATTQKAEWSTSAFWETDKLTPEQQKLARIAKEEHARCCASGGKFERIFPAENTAYLYSAFLPKSGLNWTLHVALFGKAGLVVKPKVSYLEEDLGKGEEDGGSVSILSRAKQQSLQKYSNDSLRRKGSVGGGGARVSNAPWAVVEAVDLFNDDEEESEEEEEKAGVPVAAEDAMVMKVTQQFSDTSVSAREAQKRSVDSVSAKLQAREAFQVFLENILGRLKAYSVQNQDRIDQEYVQQQVQILDRFLKQANDLHVGDDPYDRDDLKLSESVRDIETLMSKLDVFIKAYKRSTENFRNECLLHGKLVRSIHRLKETIFRVKQCQ
ncbi:Tubulin polyglutamylase ttll5 [Podochytrium sp. JEL0797]|nr:Tubulin polyglutamylase ttll5 [Podochytrium sp. JEL0797]